MLLTVLNGYEIEISYVNFRNFLKIGYLSQIKRSNYQYLPYKAGKDTILSTK